MIHDFVIFFYNDDNIFDGIPYDVFSVMILYFTSSVIMCKYIVPLYFVIRSLMVFGKTLFICITNCTYNGTFI